jgi:hypothetical protein
VNHLYYGDNLDVLRKHIKDESVDLVYLDPPFKPNQDYNVLFAEHGLKAAAQIKTFEDTWEWNIDAQHSYVLQLRTVEELLKEKSIEYPAKGQTNVTHRKARMAEADVDQISLVHGISTPQTSRRGQERNQLSVLPDEDGHEGASEAES